MHQLLCHENIYVIFWRSLEMPLIDWKVELKLKWKKYCVLSAAGADNVNNNFNDNANGNNIIFTIQDIKLHAPIVTLSQETIKTIKTSYQRIWKISLLEWI